MTYTDVLRSYLGMVFGREGIPAAFAAIITPYYVYTWVSGWISSLLAFLGF
ncbi:hypothetical protein PXQ59_002163 [Vibrio parahaemolyticus]|nr:hypothetical protein [Vibrio parahaemolyticus]